jgi:hypothetical protein
VLKGKSQEPIVRLYGMGDVGNFVNLFWVLALRRRVAKKKWDDLPRLNTLRCPTGFNGVKMNAFGRDDWVE